MKYLIDTHVCLWAIAEKEKLSVNALSILEDASTKILVSQVSLMEIAIKVKVGKLTEFNVSLSEFVATIKNTGFEILPLKDEHIFEYFNFDFPVLHRDPFDRLLIAASSYEKASLISKDEKFQLYADRIKIVW
jgi:PIN domain nuclease of toxin-antitoxin system